MFVSILPIDASTADPGQSMIESVALVAGLIVTLQEVSHCSKSEARRYCLIGSRSGNIMNKNAWKELGFICSLLWILAVESIASLYWLFAEIAKGNLGPSPAGYWAIEVFGYVLVEDCRPWIGPGYILFGVGPVIGYALLMKKLGHPLERSSLIGLGIWAAIPCVWLVGPSLVQWLEAWCLRMAVLK
jgi:hypothetical protein